MADVYYHIRYYLELGIRWMVNFPNKGIRIVSKTSMATNATGFGAKTQLRPVFLPARETWKAIREMPDGWLDQTAHPHSRAISGPKQLDTKLQLRKLLFEILLPHSFQMGVAHYRI